MLWTKRAAGAAGLTWGYRPGSSFRSLTLTIGPKEKL